jgi:hypothetical protein
MSRSEKSQIAIRLCQPRCRTITHDLRATCSPAIQGKIGRELRGMYATLLREPVPDYILTLIARLSRSPRRMLQ